MATLTEAGLRDPEAAAHLIAQPMAGRLHSAKDLRQKQLNGVELVKFRFGGKLAGHCSFSRLMDEKRVPISSAHPLPAINCEHPDQCGCRWQAWLPLMDELGL